jgi:hypothetical protein
MEFVSLQQASDHLRRDTDADDNDLRLKIRAASLAVANALKESGMAEILDSSGLVPTDSSGNPLVPEDVQWATLLVLGESYSNRGDSALATWREGEPLPAAAWALLTMRRTPGLR